MPCILTLHIEVHDELPTHIMLQHKIKKALNEIKFEVRASLRHIIESKKARKLIDRPQVKLHFACGEVYKEGWINIDLFSSKADLNLDLRRHLPFPDNSCDEIYSEHFLEHLEYPNEALFFLSELNRIIKPGKNVVTGVPDTAWPMKSYIQGPDADYFAYCRKNNWHPDHVQTPIEHINYHFRQEGEHKFAYDEETLIKIMEKAGFTSNKMRNYDPEMDSAKRQPGSLYVVSTK